MLAVVGYVLLGGVGGWLWESWWQPPAGVVTESGWTLAGPGVGEQFSGTALFALLGAGVGVLAASASAWWLRRRALLLVAVVVVGSVAATATMLVLGTSLGPQDPAVLARGAELGTRLPGALEVRGRSPFLVLPAASLTVVAAVLLLTPGTRNRTPAADEAP